MPKWSFRLIKTLKRLLFVLRSGGYACHGIINMLVAPTLILWREQPYSGGYVSGTLISKNTAAT
jgi:hypothetical protein